MNQTSHAAKTELPKPILPNWVMAGSAPNTLEAAGFGAGSVLALLHVALHDPNIDVPTELLRSKLALRAAAQCLKLEGRVQSEAEIRDAYLLAAPGDDGLINRGPAGDMLALWRSGSVISFRHAGWRERLCALLPEDMQEQFPSWMEQAEDCEGTPITKAALLLGKMVQMFPRQEAFALPCADAILARSLGWDGPLPLLGLHLKGKSLREAAQGEGILIACHEAVTRSAQDAVRLCHDLARRAAALRAIEPKLRTKGS